MLTFGHGTLDAAQITHLLRGAQIESLVDVRMAPGSRRHPQVARQALEQWLPEAAILYRWEPRLGGRRKPSPASPNVALRNESFRGYADYMRSTDFWDALDGVLRESAIHRTAIMCSESVYWRCHRRLIADAAVLQRDTAVWHLDHAGRLNAHRLTDGVRSDHGQPVYDVGGSNPLPDL